jgi:hypothetical protein
MLVNILKGTQLVVAITATILAGLIWPGIMVLIPVGIGVSYIILSMGACRDRKLSMWLACLVSASVALLSALAIGANDFAIMRTDSEMGEAPAAAVSPGGNVVWLDTIPDERMAELRRVHAIDVRTQTVVALLLIFVAFGSAAVLVMHGFAWRWLIFGKPGPSWSP